MGWPCFKSKINSMKIPTSTTIISKTRGNIVLQLYNFLNLFNYISILTNRPLKKPSKIRLLSMALSLNRYSVRSCHLMLHNEVLLPSSRINNINQCFFSVSVMTSFGQGAFPGIPIWWGSIKHRDILRDSNSFFPFLCNLLKENDLSFD